MHALQSLSWVQMQYHVFVTFTPQGKSSTMGKKNSWRRKSKREEKTETFESRLCSSLWRLLDRVHKFPPVGVVCPLKYTPSPGHPQALPLWNQNQCTRRSFFILIFFVLYFNFTVMYCIQSPLISHQEDSALLRLISVDRSVNKPKYAHLSCGMGACMWYLEA